ncbi:MAG: N-acetylmuramidase family protein [Betaproteobacteria bacterium]
MQLRQSAALLDVDALWAVMAVETKGSGFLMDRRPQILFERHVFRARTGRRFDRTDPDLSNSVAGGYGATGANQYDRLLRAIALDRIAASESTSWGPGQVMGFNAVSTGFVDVETMVHAMSDSEDSQFGAMIAFIIETDIAYHLKQGDWRGFAAAYNGPRV